MLTFSERLQYLIDYKNIKQRRLAEAVCVDPSKVSKWLKGSVKKPQRTTLVNIAVFFNCNIEWLATGEGEPFPSNQTKNMSITGDQNIQSGKSSRGASVNIHRENQEKLRLSTDERFLVNTLRKLPNYEDILAELIFQVMQEQRKPKKKQ